MGNAKSAPKNKTGKSVVKLVSRPGNREMTMILIFNLTELFALYSHTISMKRKPIRLTKLVFYLYVNTNLWKYLKKSLSE